MRHLMMLLTPLVQEAPPPPPPQPPPPMAQVFLHAAKELNLSHEQTTKLREIHEAHRDTLRALHEAFRQSQKTLMDAVQESGSGDLKGLNAKFAASHLAMVMELASVHAQSLAVLTPEQREKAKAIHARHLLEDLREHGGNAREGHARPSEGRPPHDEGSAGRPPRRDSDRPNEITEIHMI